MTDIQLVDVSIRDGNQSLWGATGLNSAQILKIAPVIGRVGFRAIDFLGPLALRLYLVPVFWVAGMNKVNGYEDVVAWFGNPDWGLGLPFPEFMAWAAALTEAGGAVDEGSAGGSDATETDSGTPEQDPGSPIGGPAGEH